MMDPSSDHIVVMVSDNPWMPIFKSNKTNSSCYNLIHIMVGTPLSKMSVALPEQAPARWIEMDVEAESGQSHSAAGG